MTATTTTTAQRQTLEGTWILDKTRADWSMTPYLQIMQVDPLAIEAHEKGDIEADTFHTIHFFNNINEVQIIKRSRVNNDLVVNLQLGMEQMEYLSPAQRPKTMIATADRERQFLEIQSKLQTMSHGTASVKDIKRLIHQDDDSAVLMQELTITNERTGQSHSLQRFFLPYLETPPHLLVVDDVEEIK